MFNSEYAHGMCRGRHPPGAAVARSPGPASDCGEAGVGHPFGEQERVEIQSTGFHQTQLVT